MSKKIDQFWEDLRLKLANIKSGLDGLRAKIDVKAHNAEQEVRAHLDQVRTRTEQSRTKAIAAQAEIKSWVEAKKVATSAKIAEWKAKHETSQLQNRADSAERYAGASIDVALAAVDEAEQAALEAWLARQDANTAQAQKA